MARITPFQSHHQAYEDWFATFHHVYKAELRAVRTALPEAGDPARTGLEIGAGSGLFSAPLGIPLALEPCAEMAARARARGLQVTLGVGERLPFADASVDYALMVTSICFMDDVPAALDEACRVLRPGAPLVIGFVDRESPLGRLYETHKADSPFYREADFYSAAEIARMAETAGLEQPQWWQTVRGLLHEVGPEEAIEPGFGAAAFVVLRVQRPT